MRQQLLSWFEGLIFGDADQPCRERIEGLLRKMGFSILTLHALIVWQQISNLRLSYFATLLVDTPIQFAVWIVGAVLFAFTGDWWEIAFKLILLVTGYLPALVVLAGPLLLTLARLPDRRATGSIVHAVLAANWLLFGMSVLAMRWD